MSMLSRDTYEYIFCSDAIREAERNTKKTVREILFGDATYDDILKIKGRTMILLSEKEADDLINFLCD